MDGPQLVLALGKRSTFENPHTYVAWNEGLVLAFEAREAMKLLMDVLLIFDH